MGSLSTQPTAHLNDMWVTTCTHDRHLLYNIGPEIRGVDFVDHFYGHILNSLEDTLQHLQSPCQPLTSLAVFRETFQTGFSDHNQGHLNYLNCPCPIATGN